MRAAGANVTDIVILVIAIDDGILQQTIEALNQAKNAKVKIIIALNKIDRMKSTSARKKIENELLNYDIITEAHNGTVPVVEISALKGIGIQNLLEGLFSLLTSEIVLQAEFLNLKACHDCNTEAIVLETKSLNYMNLI
jgi:translation initiation factor IF-2